MDHQGLELEGVLETGDGTQTSFSFQETVDQGTLENLPKTYTWAQGVGQYWDVCLTEGSGSQSALARGATIAHHRRTAADPCYSDLSRPPVHSPGHDDPGLKVYKGMGEAIKLLTISLSLNPFPSIARESTRECTELDVTGILT